MAGATHGCAICGVAVATGMLMCRRHWFLVPVALRAEVNESWRLLNVTKGRKPWLDVETNTRYQRAREAAISAARLVVPA